jgi:hypothetical protein
VLTTVTAGAFCYGMPWLGSRVLTTVTAGAPRHGMPRLGSRVLTTVTANQHDTECRGWRAAC